MQKISSGEIHSRLDQICSGLKEDSKEFMTYPEAVFVMNTFYRTFGLNMSGDVLSAVKKAADGSKNDRISKSQLRDIITNEQAGRLSHEEYRQVISNSDSEYQIQREYKANAPTPQTCLPPQYIGNSQMSTNERELRYNPNFSGSRRSITFRSTLNHVNGSSTIQYEPISVTDNSGVRITRTSNYSKSVNNGDYSYSTISNQYPLHNGEYRVVQEGSIKRVQLPSDYRNDNNQTYVKRVITHTGNHVIDGSSLLNDDRQNNEVKEQNGNFESNNGQEYSSQLQGFSIRYGDYSKNENPYVADSTTRVVYHKDQTYRIA